jgi:hypothetical protein
MLVAMYQCHACVPSKYTKTRISKHNVECMNFWRVSCNVNSMAKTRIGKNNLNACVQSKYTYVTMQVTMLLVRHKPGLRTTSGIHVHQSCIPKPGLASGCNVGIPPKPGLACVHMY